MSETLQWIAVDGTVLNLSDDTMQTYYAEGPASPLGEYGLPVTIISHGVPLQAGVREQWVQINANDVRFPLRVFGATQADLDRNLRVLSEATRPTRGVGILQHTSNDGTVRQLFCRETARFRDVPAQGPGWMRFGMIFSAADPYWYDPQWTTFTAVPGGAVAFFQVPFLPLHMSVGGISSGFSVTNGGQDIVWPVWQIAGPGTNPVLTNLTTNQVLTLTATLTAGQILTVDTRPLYINVTREDGSNQWGTVSDVSQLWPLAVGANRIALAMSGTGAGSQLTLQYKQVYEGV